MTTAQSTFKKVQKGFTLIELLIVIAILGVLAAAVLSAINPIEQINRGRDTGSLSDAEQLLSATSRFNAAQGYLPWMYGEGDTSDTQDTSGTPAFVQVCGTGGPNGCTPWHARTAANTLGNTSATEVLNLLGANTAVNTVGTGELLPAYVNRINSTTGNPLYIFNDGTPGASTYVCFRSQSGSFSVKAKNRCGANQGDGLPADLQSIGPSNLCDVTVGNADHQYFTCLP